MRQESDMKRKKKGKLDVVLVPSCFPLILFFFPASSPDAMIVYGKNKRKMKQRSQEEKRWKTCCYESLRFWTKMKSDLFPSLFLMSIFFFFSQVNETLEMNWGWRSRTIKHFYMEGMESSDVLCTSFRWEAEIFVDFAVDSSSSKTFIRYFLQPFIGLVWLCVISLLLNTSQDQLLLSPYPLDTSEKCQGSERSGPAKREDEKGTKENKKRWSNITI